MVIGHAAPAFDGPIDLVDLRAVMIDDEGQAGFRASRHWRSAVITHSATSLRA